MRRILIGTLAISLVGLMACNPFGPDQSVMLEVDGLNVPSSIGPGSSLTVGMSVDNNILINERIREEIHQGKGMRAAVEVGYKRALAAIVDGHVTTVIAGIVLWQYGTGSLKGFAITLMVGVICNVFTGVVVTRMMFDLWVRWIGRTGQLDMG